MPIENDFLPFAVGSTANVEAQSTWVSDTVLQTGFQSGIANSTQVNKVLRQASIMAAMLAQFIVDNSGQPAIDNGTTATLEANLRTGINALISAFVANALGAGGTIYSPQFASLSTDAFDASGAGQIRLMYGNYGVILRNDGGTLWILLTNSGNPSGTFNGLRPLSINLSTGAVSFDGTGVGSSFGGNVTAPSATISGNETVAGTVTAGTLNVSGNAAISGSATAATPATGNRSNQVATTQCFANEFVVSMGLNGYQKLPSGLIIQWGGYGSAQSGSPTTINLPITFPNAIFSIASTDVGLAGNSSVHLTSVSAKSLSQLVVYANNPATNSPANTNVGWIAIGY